jgi:hypothetical protein
MEPETIELKGDSGAEQPAPFAEPDAEFDVAGIDTAEDADEGPQLSADEVRERRTLVRRISRYKRIFPEECSELLDVLQGLGQKSPAELTELLAEVQFAVECRRSTGAARGLFVAGLQAGEFAGPFVGLKLNGLAATAATSAELLRTVDEVALKYESCVAVDPVARLAMAVGQLCLAIDGANRAAAANGPAPPQPTVDVAVVAPPQPRPTAGLNSRDEFSDL